MDLRQFWKYNYQSICKIRHLKAGKTIGGGTGFKIDSKIITNSHVYNPADADEIQINFVDKDCVTPTLTKTYKKDQFEKLLLDAMPPNSWDFAILDASDDVFNFIPSLVLADTDHSINIGQPCFFPWLSFIIKQPFNSFCHCIFKIHVDHYRCKILTNRRKCE